MKKSRVTLNIEELNKHELIGYLLKKFEIKPNDEYLLQRFEELKFNHITRKFHDKI